MVSYGMLVNHNHVMGNTIGANEHESYFVFEEILKDKKMPLFQTGYPVEVILNDRNKAYHKGTIASRGWHLKEKEWYYFIKENGKLIKKRYFEYDLNLLIHY
ncbi:MAG: hypothetical protein Q8942_08545 [Bacillota bacterium]|nr:hypothetical protein [Bacillota bacterium]